MAVSGLSIAQDSARAPKPHKARAAAHKKRKPAVKPTPTPTEKQRQATKKMLLQRALKEKGFHLPDTSKHQ